MHYANVSVTVIVFRVKRGTTTELKVVIYSEKASLQITDQL